jgi:hypothetical protein
MKIITIEDKNPLYIEMQYNSLVKHLKTPFDYIVYNNAFWDHSRHSSLNQFCDKLRIESVNIFPDTNYEKQYNVKLFGNTSYLGASEAHLYPLLRIWNDYKDLNEKIVILNSDMFLMKDVDFEHAFGNKQIAFVPTYNVNNNNMSAWGGILFLDVSNMPNKNDFDLSLGYIGNERVDTGGKTYHYFKNNNVTKNYLEFWTLLDYAEELTANINGNMKCSFEAGYDQTYYNFERERRYSNKLFEYEIEKDNYIDYILGNFLYIFKKIAPYDFPRPYIIEFMKLYNETIEDSFILHMQGGSNYIGFPKEYMDQRISAVRKMLEI